MHRPRVASGALLAGAIALALSACGSSTTSSSSAATTQPTSAPTSAAANSGSSFCTQVGTVMAQLSHLSTGFSGASPGATPDVASLKQLIATADAAIDALDSSAPGDIASAFHTLRAAYDQANSQVQSATTIEQIAPAMAGFAAPAVATAGRSITAYMTTSCGITASPSPSP